MVTRADATSAIYSAFFVEDAETLRRGRGLRAVIERKGRCSSLSTDRGAPSWFTEEAGGKGGTTRLTQMHRAFHQVGVTLIPAYSPEARGRSERMFRTLQDRRPNARVLAGITERAAANRYLPECFLPQSNDRVMGRATAPGPAFIPGIGTHVADRLCVHEEWVVVWGQVL